MTTATSQTLPPLRSSSKGSSWVQPASPLQASLTPCSAIENLCARVYPSPTYFFPLKGGDDPLQHYANLSRGLGRVFNQFPFLAGRLRQDTRDAFSIEIPESPQAGTRFHYTDLTRDFTFPSFQELQAGGFPYGDGKMDGLSRLRPNPFPHHEDGCPVIVPQLTHVRGGLILTCSYSHLVADLLLLSAWCNNWALQTHEVATAALEGRAEAPVPETCAPHVIDRSRLTPPNPGPSSLAELSEQAKAISDWILVDPTNAIALENMKNNVPPAYIPASVSSQEETALRASTVGLWRFSAASLKALHAAAQAASPEGTKVTSMDVLTAYLWTHIFRAKYTDPSSSEDKSHFPEHSEIVYAGDIRRRLNPPLPKDYVGAGVDLFRCAAEPSTLASPSSSSQNSQKEEMANLATLATSIRLSNSTWSEEKYMTLLSLSQRTPFSPGFVPRGPIDVLTTDHSRGASVITADWGPGLGATVAYREPYLGRDPPAGEVTILARGRDGSLDVMISAEKVVVERLQKEGGLGVGEVVFVLHDVVKEKAARDSRAKL